MEIKLKVARTHVNQLSNPSVQTEFASIQQELNRVSLQLENGKICMFFVKGYYEHSERKLITACLFINMLDFSISELHGQLRIKLKNCDAVVAKAELNFDSDFLGTLKPKEALLTHINFPVKGLKSNEVFLHSDVECWFNDVRVSKASEEKNG